jgi:phosphoglycolate phosphatase
VKDRLKNLLSKLSFRTGVIILISCVVFYILSFVQALLPLSTSTKGVLFIVFFGLAKTTQYTGLAIVGVQGWQRIKAYIRLKRKKS